MLSLPFDVYPLVRPLLFRMDAEKAHALAICSLKRGLVPAVEFPRDPVLRSRFCGLDFDHPVGLAAGFDKQAEVIGACFDLGFSSVELGAVTPVPQSGNPKPRMFRIPEAKAVINRFGFNSVGAEVFLERLMAYYGRHPRHARRVIGINLAKNKETANAGDDYIKGVKTFAPRADFLTVNVSSPNTPGLRDIQERSALADLLKRIMETRAASGKKPLLLLKIAPDIGEAQAHDIAEVSVAAGIDGMIVSNTTISRPAALPPALAKQAGGLSGRPLFEMSTKLLGLMYRLTEGKMPMIGSGGVFSGADAYAKIRAGASLVQIYTAMVYEGPGVVARINAELAGLLKRDGFESVRAAVGADFKG